MRIVNVLFPLMLGAALLPTSELHAQDALGSGNALDNNLRVGSGGINAPTPTPNFRDRNLIVTGDVIGGRGFRGSVGYTAEADFRGSLGSNDLFNFRAGSVSSSPYFQLGTTYERLRFGQDIGIVEYRRAGSGAPESVNAQNPIGIGGGENDRLRLDRRIVSSSLALSPQQFVEPRVVGGRAEP